MKFDVRWYDFIFALILIYLLSQVVAVWSFTIDDMYISLRYATNWASGAGLLWNTDSPPVEGYSNFSFVVLGALSILAKKDPVLVLKGAGVVGLLCSGLFVFLITRFWFSLRLSFIPVVYLFLYKGELVWAVSGLETTVYQALLCGSVFFIFYGLGYRFVPNQRGPINNKSLVAAGLTLFLAAITRPEAPLFMVVFFILMCIDNLLNPEQKNWKGIILFVTAFGLCFVPYFLWRWHYYGYFFPNPVYCKGFVNYWFYLDWNYLLFIWPFALLAIPACLVSKDIRHYFLCLPSILYLILLMNSDPLVAYYNRLFLVTYALLLPLAQEGLSVLIVLYTKVKDEVYVFSLILLSAVLAVLFIPKSPLFDLRYFAQHPIQGLALRMQLVDWLEVHAHSDDTVVLGDAGIVPYYSRLKFIDSYCLNDKLTAHDSKILRYEHFCERTLKQKPHIIILTSLTDEHGLQYQPSDICFKKAFATNKEYQSSAFFSVGVPPRTYRYEVYTSG